MESQIQRMKSSIANIQQNLRKLETENQQTTKLHDNDENILPESLIHEDVITSPQPSPKITQSKPNIIHIDTYTPHRHHLDDSEMKKALQYSDPDHPLKKSKSQTIKTQYLYDGARVAYVPPIPTDYSDYGHIVIRTKNSHSNSSQDNSLKSNKKTKMMRSNIELKRVNQQDVMGSTRIKNSQKKYEKNKKPKKYKVSQHPPIQIEQNTFSQYKIRPPPKQRHRVEVEEKVFRNYKTQCNLKKIRIKEPFTIGFKSDTDSQFSDMEL